MSHIPRHWYRYTYTYICMYTWHGWTICEQVLSCAPGPITAHEQLKDLRVAISDENRWSGIPSVIYVVSVGNNLWSLTNSVHPDAYGSISTSFAVTGSPWWIHSQARRPQHTNLLNTSKRTTLCACVCVQRLSVCVYSPSTILTFPSTPRVTPNQSLMWCCWLALVVNGTH